jgi:hypothetical protein
MLGRSLMVGDGVTLRAILRSAVGIPSTHLCALHSGVLLELCVVLVLGCVLLDGVKVYLLLLPGSWFLFIVRGFIKIDRGCPVVLFFTRPVVGACHGVVGEKTSISQIWLLQAHSDVL